MPGIKNVLPLQPGTLWPAVLHQTEHARRCGALRSIATTQESIEDHGVQFSLRVVSTLAQKDNEKTLRTEKVESAGQPINPFLPYEQDLFVASVSDTHLVLLNKFNVVEHHLLIVTRRFEEQEALLNVADFEAVFACMAEFESLAFYNGGTVAGSSQRHKHLQLVPLPLAKEGPRVPIEPLFASTRMNGLVGTIQNLPFLHAFARLDSVPANQPVNLARAACECYLRLLAATGLRAIESNGDVRQSAPYNLLLTREWMLLIPRSTESVEGVGVNALGFAGLFFVRTKEDTLIVRRLGPITLLQQAAISRN